MQERQFALVPLFAWTIILYHLEWHVRSKILIHRVSCCWSMPDVSLRLKQDKPELWKQRWQSPVLQLRQRSSYLARAIARLIVMSARVICRSSWGFCTCVDTRTYDRTCLWAWSDAPFIQWYHIPSTQLGLLQWLQLTHIWQTIKLFKSYHTNAITLL